MRRTSSSMLTSLWFILAASFTAMAAQGACPSGWTESSTSQTCIKAYTSAATWREARETCQAEGGDLVKITDQEMDTLVKDITCGLNTLVWIGLNDIGDEGTYVWLDEEEEEMSYENWGDGLPYGNYEVDDCVFAVCLSGVVGYEYYYWMDYNCSSEFFYVCETSALTTTMITTTTSAFARDSSAEKTTATAAAAATTTTTPKAKISSSGSVSSGETVVNVGGDDVTSLGSILSYLLLIVAVLVCLTLILVIFTVVILQRCHFATHRTWTNARHATKDIGVEDEGRRFSNNVYNLP